MPLEISDRRALAMALLLWCLMAMSATSAAMSRGAPGPLKRMPAKWLHLPEECIDCWIGAYHDAESGAYVRYSSSSPEDDRRYESFGLKGAEGSTTTGRVGDVPYRLLRVPDGRSYMSHRLELATGTPTGQLPSSTARLLPPPGLPYIVVTLLSKPWVWCFEAAISTRSQEERLTSLLLSANRLEPGTSGNVYERSRALDIKGYTGTRRGTTASEFLRRFGRPRASYKQDAYGFALVYHVTRTDESRPPDIAPSSDVRFLEAAGSGDPITEAEARAGEHRLSGVEVTATAAMARLR